MIGLRHCTLRQVSPWQKNSERAPLQVEPIGADKRDHARIGLPVLGIEQVALPFVGAGFDRAADNHRADLGAARPLADDLAAELAAAIEETDLGPVRWPHPLAVGFGGQGRRQDQTCGESRESQTRGMFHQEASVRFEMRLNVNSFAPNDIDGRAKKGDRQRDNPTD